MIKFFCIALLLGLSSNGYAKELTMSIDEWCPFICLSSEQRGILIEIVEDIFGHEGYHVKFVRMPLARAAVETKHNRVQAIVGIIPAVAPSLVFPKEPVISTQFCFFTLPSQTWQFRGLKESYPDTKIGIVRGKVISPDFDNAFPTKMRITGSRFSERMIKILNAGRITTFIEERTTVAHTLKRNPQLPKLYNAGCVKEKQEYVAFSPANPKSREYAEIFSEGIRRLKRSGKIDSIISSYTE